MVVLDNDEEINIWQPIENKERSLILWSALHAKE